MVNWIGALCSTLFGFAVGSLVTLHYARDFYRRMMMNLLEFHQVATFHAFIDRLRRRGFDTSTLELQFQLCPVCGGMDSEHCSRCLKVRKGGAMLKMKCQICKTEVEGGKKLAAILPCPACQSETLHFRSDRFDELAALPPPALADLLIVLHRGEREE